MAKRQNRDEKWEEVEARIQEELKKARKRGLLANNFDEMEEVVVEVGQIIQQEMMAGMAEQREPGGRPVCSECGEEMYRRGRKARQVKTSRGEVKFERDRWICPQCNKGIFPPR